MAMSSPTAAVKLRRAQYKCRTPEAVSRSLFARPGNTVAQPAFYSSPAEKSLLRDRFRAQCFERTQRARKISVQERRTGLSSDSSGCPGFGTGDEEMDGDEEETDDDVMRDELFRRIMQSTQRRRTHAYRLSYSLEVGSSFDPDLEDVSEWERELQAEPPVTRISTPNSSSMSGPTRTSISTSTLPLNSILDEQEELEAYAEEYAKQDFDDISLSEEWFPLSSDDEDRPSSSTVQGGQGRDETTRMLLDAGGDQGMDMS